MTPYSRFRLISTTAAAALIAGGLCAVWPLLAGMIAAATGGVTAAYTAFVAVAALLSVVALLTLSEAVLPALFQLPFLRRMVLGRHYVEGTWLQAERGPSGSERLTVLHIRPAGAGYDLSGYSLNQESEIESNRMVEYTKLDGPVLFHAYRSLMPDGAGNQARGTSELMFEQRRGAPKAYSGYGEPVGGRRYQIEGVKLTRWSERRRLRKLDQRAGVVETYWKLFFGAAATEVQDTAYEPPAVRRPVIVEAARPAFVERRNPDRAPSEDGPLITRRRASDWRSEDATPTADRIRARMLEAEEAIEEDDENLLLEEEIEDDLDDAAEFDAEEDEADEVLLEDDEELEYEADAEDDEEIDDIDAFEDDEPEAFTAEAEDEDTPPATDDEPVRIRQRYARR
jgi:hypothetical protein